nr:forkhead box protein H1-like [Pogona vitticeps]
MFSTLPGSAAGGNCWPSSSSSALGAMAGPEQRWYPMPKKRGSPERRSGASALAPSSGLGAGTSEEEEGEEEEDEERAKEGQDPRPAKLPPAPKEARKPQRKKKYHRHPKPPYTYLAMIALVIQASPERKLKLSQIIKEISILFPFFKEGYQGWKDSVRHNLSSNDCFHKVLKDPTKPKAKGNFWTVDLGRIPHEALKLQNTPISRQEEGMFAADLAPYVFQGLPLGRPPAAGNAADESPGFSPEAARQASPFSIDSLLSDFQDVGLCGKRGADREGPPPRHPAAGLDFWGPIPLFRLSAGRPLLPRRPSCPQPALRSFSSSSSLSSLGSLSPREGGEAGRPRARKGHPPHLPAKRPRGHPDPESSGSDSESSRGGTPPPCAPHWEQLPTSYTTSVAPNVVAPLSYPPPFSAFPPVPGLSFCSAPVAALASPASWERRPGGTPMSTLPSQLSVDLDQGMPPNKTVYDVWMTHPSDTAPPAARRPDPCLPGGFVAPYDPSWEEP